MSIYEYAGGGILGGIIGGGLGLLGGPSCASWGFQMGSGFGLSAVKWRSSQSLTDKVGASVDRYTDRIFRNAEGVVHKGMETTDKIVALAERCSYGLMATGTLGMFYFLGYSYMLSDCATNYSIACDVAKWTNAFLMISSAINISYLGYSIITQFNAQAPLARTQNFGPQQSPPLIQHPEVPQRQLSQLEHDRPNRYLRPSSDPHYGLDFNFGRQKTGISFDTETHIESAFCSTLVGSAMITSYALPPVGLAIGITYSTVYGGRRLINYLTN